MINAWTSEQRQQWGNLVATELAKMDDTLAQVAYAETINLIM